MLDFASVACRFQNLINTSSLQVASSGTPLTVDSVEGRAFLHDQSKLLHEKYIQYAHRVCLSPLVVLQ